MDHFEEIPQVDDDIESLGKWEEENQRLTRIRGPEGITLENTNELQMENPRLKEMFIQVKKTYDELVRDRLVVSDNKNDLFKGILERGGGGALAGYSFFIEKKQESPDRTHRTDFLERARANLLKMAEERRQDKLMGINPDALPGRKRPLSETIAEVRKVFASGPEIITPTTSSRGGIKLGYSQFISATIVKSMISKLKSPQIDLHIICSGYNDILNEVFDMPKIVDSEAFQTAKRKDIRPGTTRRICIWLSVKDHVLMLVWDSVNRGEGRKITHKMYSCDSATYVGGSPINANRLYLVIFRDSIKEYSGRNRNDCEILDNQITKEEIRVDEGGLMCVSFVTRATIYLSMIIDPINHKDIIRQMSHFDEGNKIDAFLYRCFESHLFTLIHNQTMDGNLVMFSGRNMYKKAVNINDINLIIENGGNGMIDTLVYKGVDTGFKVGRGNACITASHFTPFYM